MNSYQELTVWQKGVELVTEIYKLSESFPKNELYGLTNQMRRAAVSIPANIAEGFARKHRQEYIQFVRFSFASGAELETHLVIAQKLGFSVPAKYKKVEGLLSEVMRMLNKLLQSLVAKP